MGTDQDLKDVRHVPLAQVASLAGAGLLDRNQPQMPTGVAVAAFSSSI